MPNKPSQTRTVTPLRTPVDKVGSLASQALSVLVSRRGQRGPGLSEGYLARLSKAVLTTDQRARDRVVDEMLEVRITRTEIADQYIPEVARRLGVAWCEDTMSFAEVTIGAARLQGLLREMTDDWSAGAEGAAGGPNVVVMVVADEYHTLGPMLITSQLRRLGVSVRLLLGRPLPEVQAIVRDRDFDAIFISVAHVERLAQIAGIVSLLRSNMHAETPIVVGGAAIEEEPMAQALTGADHVCNDIRKALTLCGLGERIASAAEATAGS